MTACPPRAPLGIEDGSPGRVLQAAVEAAANGQRAALAVVLETEGSTYTRAGTVALFAEGGHVGWLSGGCLEPEIERRALQAVDRAQLDWMEIDTRDDDALFSGNAVGCRGRQRVALLPLPALPDLGVALVAWLSGAGTLHLTLHADGSVNTRCDGVQLAHRLASAAVPWDAPREQWALAWHRAPSVAILGAGPEAGPLFPILSGLGWRTSVHDPRQSWRERSHVQAVATATPLHEVLRRRPAPDAVLVMHHNFERDLEALLALAASNVPFIGLLGPVRRREDLFKLLPEDARASLRPRLRSPVGLSLGGRGPEAIALSIAAQLQAWRHGSSLELQ